MTSVKGKKIIKILAIVSPWFLLLFSSGFVDLKQPDIKVSLDPSSDGNLTSTTITITNTGKEPATNLRITFNPFIDIVSYKKIFYTEEIEFESTGPQNLIGVMNRLANDQKIVLETTLNVSIKQFRSYNIHVAHDDGSTNYSYSSTELPFELQLVLSITWVTILTLYLLQRFGMLYKKNLFKKSKVTEEQPVIEIEKNTLSEVPVDPFLKISLTKDEYKNGDTIKARWSFSGLRVGEIIWTGVYNPKNELVTTKKLKVEKPKGEFSLDLLTISKWKEKGEYTVKTDTEMGPESSTQFQFKG